MLTRIATRRVPLARTLARGLQTSADTTTLATLPPSSSSQPFKLTLHEDSFQAFRCDKPSLEVEVTKDMLVDMYTQMTMMRRMEMAADALYKAKLIRGFCHLAIGQVRQRSC
ncbi:alpha subunit of pyruvate dehydrogenase [Tulasnella sp. 418]|nr:alpha subunit of pyruvate dehydrogenase [Tulasnella sp. 418]